MKLLVVRWSESSAASYYIDKGYAVRKINGGYKYYGFSGDYTFTNGSNIVELDTGAEIRNTSVVNWCVIDADSDYPDWF